MKISIIGAGNTAWNISRALHNAHHQIEWISNRTLENAKELASVVGAKASSTIEGQDWGNTELILICTRDDGYQQVANQLRTTIPVAHTSGSVSMEILKGCSSQIGVFYPLQSMLKNRLTDFSMVPFCIEANTGDFHDLLSNLARQLSDKIYTINSEERKKLHLSAIFSSNFSNFLYILSKDFLVKNGLPAHILDPLILETSLRIENSDPSLLQTGPAKRGDYSIIRKHLDMLDDNPIMRDVYKLMSQRILEYYNHNSIEIEKL